MREMKFVTAIELEGERRREVLTQASRGTHHGGVAIGSVFQTRVFAAVAAAHRGLAAIVAALRAQNPQRA